MTSHKSITTMDLYSRNICFVCGSIGASSTVHVKPREKGSYFPFLEHHDPPKGSIPAGPSGTVMSCNVCYSFLNQQWEAFERSKTPAIKRLYWLKRADNGQFTGAEMRWQGEYAAQVMGLQYTPGSYVGGLEDYSLSDSRASLVSPISATGATDTASRESMRTNVDCVTREHIDTNGALDLSMPSRLKDYQKPAAGMTQNYKTESGTSQQYGQDIPAADNVLSCFVCATPMNGSHGRSLYSRRLSDKEPFFPFLEKLPTPEGAVSVTKKGVTRVCGQCKKCLCQQWKAYEVTNTPEEHRIYRVNNEPIGFGKRNMNVDPASDSVTQQDVCYLCAQVSKSENMKNIYTKSSSSGNSMYFPFITHLQCPPRAKLMDSDGLVKTCNLCYIHLKQQWELFESEGLSEKQRHYSLRPLHTVLNSANPASVAVCAANNLHLNQPLNIHISSVTPPAVSASPSQGLLAIAPGNSATPTKMDHKNHSSHGGYINSQSSHLPSTVQVSKSSTVSVIKGTATPCSTEGRSSSTMVNPVSICFLCGFKCSGGKYYVLRAYPCEKDQESAKKAFFPFLLNRKAADGAETITSDGSVKSCRYCYHSLILQWGAYEVVCDPGDAKRHRRRYTVDVFVCFVCGVESERKKMRTIMVKKFPFLIKHPNPPGAVVIGHGESVVVCYTCERTLARQYDDYERMGVQINLRQYNWIGKPAEQASHYFLEISKSEVFSQEDEDQQTSELTGLPPGSKPPPLTMVSPASNKVTRTTATVQPLSQVSPSSGITSVGRNSAMTATRASSFAAALRKLAKQAVDPADTIHDQVREASPATSKSNASPQSTTPKRGLPPAVYSHSQSSSTPPVVAIAPTPSHSSHTPGDGRKSLDRTNYSSTSMIEPTNIKQEQEKLSSSHERRDDDRVRDPSKRLTPHSVLSSASISREDSMGSRGFQPYRHGEEIRPSLPAHYSSIDPTTAYSYSTAFMQPPAFPHPAFRFDDPILLERYRMMQSSFLPYPHPGLLPPHGLAPLMPTGARYPHELLPHHQMNLISPGSHLLENKSSASVERKKNEEEQQLRRERELEREREKERERERARERERERERERALEQVRIEREKEAALREESIRMESPSGSRFGSITQGTPRDLTLSESHKNAIYQQQDPLLLKKYEESKWQDRHQLHLVEKEREQMLHHQRLFREQDIVLREREKEHDRRDGGKKSIPQNSPRSLDDPLHTSRPSDIVHNLHRPFEQKPSLLNNGFDRNHFTDYECHRKTERITAQDRMLEQSVSGHDRRHPQERPGNSRDRTPPRNSRAPHDRLSGSRRLLATPDHLPDQDRPSSCHELTNHRVFDALANEGRMVTNKETEGMHARLVESEKGVHFLPLDEKPLQPSFLKLNHYDYDRPHPQFNYNLNVDSSSVNQKHADNKESINTYLLTRESRTQEPFDGNKELESRETDLVSKLDVEEQKLQKARLSGAYNSDMSDYELDEEDEDERRIQRCLLIAEGPALKLDTSPAKLKFFKNFSLTSQEIKRDIDFEHKCKRRRLYGEPSISPVLLAEESESHKEHLLIPPSINPDDLNREPNFRLKARFLMELGLEMVNPERRKDVNAIWAACQEEKNRRLIVRAEHRPEKCDKVKATYSDDAAQTSPSKRKHQDTEEDLPLPSNHQPEKNRISLGQLQECHLLSNRQNTFCSPQHASPHHSQSAHPSFQTHSSHGHLSGENHAVMSPELQDKTKVQRGLSSREFAEEFHQSVLKTTRLQELSKNGSVKHGGADKPVTSESPHMLSSSSSSLTSASQSGQEFLSAFHHSYQSQTPNHHQSTSLSSHHSSLHKPSLLSSISSSKRHTPPATPQDRASRVYDSSASYRWPGIEVLMESYQKHVEEQRLERSVLVENCHMLQQRNHDLNKAAEALSLRMGDLLHAKRQLDEERARQQGSIDSLKKCLKVLR